MANPDQKTILLEQAYDELKAICTKFQDETGATVTEVSLAGGESKVLDLLVTVGSQATYDEEGYSFKAVASALSDSNLIGRQSIDSQLE